VKQNLYYQGYYNNEDIITEYPSGYYCEESPYINNDDLPINTVCPNNTNSFVGSSNVNDLSPWIYGVQVDVLIFIVQILKIAL